MVKTDWRSEFDEQVNDPRNTGLQSFIVARSIIESEAEMRNLEAPHLVSPDLSDLVSYWWEWVEEQIKAAKIEVLEESMKFRYKPQYRCGDCAKKIKDKIPNLNNNDPV